MIHLRFNEESSGTLEDLQLAVEDGGVGRRSTGIHPPFDPFLLQLLNRYTPSFSNLGLLTLGLQLSPLALLTAGGLSSVPRASPRESSGW